MDKYWKWHYYGGAVMAADYMTELCNVKKKEFQESGYPELCDHCLSEEVMISMRDGVRLHTIVYRPAIEQEKYPVILMRTCYPMQASLYEIYGENLAKRGYVFVCQYARGRGKSEGEWEPNINERNDGIDTVIWLDSQKWCETIGYCGHSYMGLMGWAMADAVEGKVCSMYLEDYGTDRYVSAYEKGAFRHDILTSWSMENAKSPIDADYLESCRYMPQTEVDVKLWGQRMESYQQYIRNTRITDDFWQEGWWKELREIPKNTKIPICMTSGWYDHHHGSSMKTWNRLNEEAKKHSWLIIGGWNHYFLPCLPGKKVENNQCKEVQMMLKWFQTTLKEKKLPEQQILIYQIGEDRWKKLDNWNSEQKKSKVFFLTKPEVSEKWNLGNLAEDLAEEVNEFSYCYDPKNPVETVGGEGLLKNIGKIGSLLQPEAGYRSDVLSFISDPLEKAVVISGKIYVKLYVKTDCDDTAFTAKVMEMTPDKKAYHIRSSITTIAHELPEGVAYTPNSIVEVICEMWDIAYTLKEGSRIRVDISSSDFPQYNIHSNYAGIWSEQTKVKKAQQTIMTGVQFPSSVCFDVD